MHLGEDSELEMPLGVLVADVHVNALVSMYREDGGRVESDPKALRANRIAHTACGSSLRIGGGSV